MSIRIFKPKTPGTRNRGVLSFIEITKNRPEKSLVEVNHRVKGRNNKGRITISHRGGGHKKCYRLIDFKRRIHTQGKVKSIEYDPNRSSNIALIHSEDGKKYYILHPENLRINDFISSGKSIEIKTGNCLPLASIPLGLNVHNIELTPKKGGQIARSAGTRAKILAKDDKYVTLRLPSKEIRLINKECFATIGRLGNRDHTHFTLGKAGRTRWQGIRPTVRGIVMNACDHPHGGGEGRSPIGKKRPLTPWGKAALGIKTRKKNKTSNTLIIRKKK